MRRRKIGRLGRNNGRIATPDKSTGPPVVNRMLLKPARRHPYGSDSNGEKIHISSRLANFFLPLPSYCYRSTWHSLCRRELSRDALHFTTVSIMLYGNGVLCLCSLAIASSAFGANAMCVEQNGMAPVVGDEHDHHLVWYDYNFIGGYYGPGAPTNQGQHLSAIKSDHLVGTQAWVYHSLATAKSGVAYSSLHHTVFHSVSRVSVGSLVWQCHTTPPAGAVSGHSTSYSGGGGYNGGYP